MVQTPRKLKFIQKLLETEIDKLQNRYLEVWINSKCFIGESFNEIQSHVHLFHSKYRSSSSTNTNFQLASGYTLLQIYF